MLTLKFGGTSMGSAQRILDSVEIMIGRAKSDRISVVVSAVAGVSNKLQEAIDGCISGQSPEAYVQQLHSIHTEILAELKSTIPSLNTETVSAKIAPLFDELKKLLSAISAFGECPDNAHCRIMGMGELLCSPIVEAVLSAKGQSVLLLDSRKYIFTTGSQKEICGNRQSQKNVHNTCCSNNSYDYHSPYSRRKRNRNSTFCIYGISAIYNCSCKSY